MEIFSEKIIRFSEHRTRTWDYSLTNCFTQPLDHHTANSEINKFFLTLSNLKDVLYEVRCLKSNEDMILALAGQFKQLSHEPAKFR